ncbi:MAG: hypothetical protein ACRCZI_11455 [Cetobacterium sp.]
MRGIDKEWVQRLLKRGWKVWGNREVSPDFIYFPLSEKGEEGPHFWINIKYREALEDKGWCLKFETDPMASLTVAQLSIDPSQEEVEEAMELFLLVR